MQGQTVTDSSNSNYRNSLLHVCGREILRPLRDQILRLSGYQVESTTDAHDALKRFQQKNFDLVLIDVEGECSIPDAEALCSELKTERTAQLVAFVCNWRVAIRSECPDDIVRTEFDPQAFVDGVEQVLAKH